MKTKALSYVFLVIAVGLGYYLYRAVAGPIEEKERIEKAENKVIDKLMVIREAEKAYIKANGNYAGKWEELISFVETGKIPNIQIIEKSYPRPDRPWLGDSVAQIQDTLEILSAREVINTELKKQLSKTNSDLTQFNAKDLPYKPESDEKFDIYAGKTEIGGVMVDIVEVKDLNPIDKTRKEDAQMANRRPLRFGSRDEVSTSGNWE